jgi:two-component system KDP operon response regulator KdpE
MTTVVVADPERRSRRQLAAALRASGYLVETAKSIEDVLTLIHYRRVEAVIVDPSTEPADHAIVELRARTDVPIIVIHCSSTERDRVALLDAGADDYMIKPFGIEELLARLRAALRRTPMPSLPIATDDFTMFLADRRVVRHDGTEVQLTATEWRVVDILVASAGHLVVQSDLMTAVWGPQAVEKTVNLRVHMAAIRRKLEPDPSHPRYFITAPGIGLRFDPTASQPVRLDA